MTKNPRAPLKEIPASKAYRLQSGPVVLATTAARGRPNVMTMGFYLLMQHDPLRAATTQPCTT